MRPGSVSPIGNPFLLSAFPISAFPSVRFVEVGTPVARRPPHRSRRAVFPHQMWCTTFGALCGQLGYVVLRFENPAFTGVLEVSTPHNVLHSGPVTNLSLGRRCRHVQNPRPLFSGDFAPSHATSEQERSNGRSLNALGAEYYVVLGMPKAQ